MKQSKLKVKKYEAYLKKSLEALRKIGKELSETTQRLNKDYKKSNTDFQPMQISDLDKELYKDSVNILGVSMDELEEFMNP